MYLQTVSGGCGLRRTTPGFPRICRIPGRLIAQIGRTGKRLSSTRAPLPCLTRVRTGPKGRPAARDEPKPRRHPSPGPGRTESPASISGWRLHAGPSPASRPLATAQASCNRYVRGRETAPAEQGSNAHDAQARSGEGEDRPPRPLEPDRRRQDACGTGWREKIIARSDVHRPSSEMCRPGPRRACRPTERLSPVRGASRTISLWS